jgi:hypothetical protein
MGERGRISGAVRRAAAEAAGRRHRLDPVQPRTGGPAGNARLTAWIGLLALLVIGAELVTLLDVTGLIRWHVGIGIVLTSLVLLKVASTGWRVVRYYLGAPAYVRAGPPPMLLRLLGPFVVLSSLGVLGSGLALLAIGRDGTEHTWFALLGHQVSAVTLHQAFFVLFAVFAGLHVLARLVPAAVVTSGWPRTGAPRPRVPGRAARLGVLTTGMAAALVAVLVVLPTVSDWNHHLFDRDDLHHSRVSH